MTRMTGPDCAVMCNLINTHTHTVANRARGLLNREKKKKSGNAPPPSPPPRCSFGENTNKKSRDYNSVDRMLQPLGTVSQLNIISHEEPSSSQPMFPPNNNNTTNNKKRFDNFPSLIEWMARIIEV